MHKIGCTQLPWKYTYFSRDGRCELATVKDLQPSVDFVQLLPAHVKVDLSRTSMVDIFDILQGFPPSATRRLKNPKNELRTQAQHLADSRKLKSRVMLSC